MYTHTHTHTRTHTHTHLAARCAARQDIEEELELLRNREDERPEVCDVALQGVTGDLHDLLREPHAADAVLILFLRGQHKLSIHIYIYISISISIYLSIYIYIYIYRAAICMICFESRTPRTPSSSSSWGVGMS